MVSHFKILSDLRRDFWGVLAGWQDRRPIWLLGGGLALALELFSWAYFQNFLKLNPCGLCVYIRFSMVVIFLGASVAAVRPASLPFKLAGGLIAFWGMIQGLLWDVALALTYRQVEASPWGVICSPGEIGYPLGLPLDQWLPGHFAPTALCGEDGWSLWGYNMAEWLFLVYGAFLVGLSLLLGSWAVRSIRRRL